MKTFYSPKPLKYDGKALRSHFIYEHAGLLGDACLAFIGESEVTLENMVDLEDVREQKPIYSPCMLHFILEHYNFSLREAIAFQRLMVVNVQEELQQQGVLGLIRRGDDIFFIKGQKEKKLSVSIAAPALNSQLIHLGLNIQTENTPVPTVGLKDWKINIKNFAQNCLQRFQQEEENILKASYKVRSVI